MKVAGMKKWVDLFGRFEMVVTNPNHGTGGENVS
jgi:hypothetical protein